MITPRRHPRGETLMSYAAGALDPAFALVLCCHLQFCALCQRRARALDEVGGVLLERMAAPDDEAFSARTMGRFSAGHAQDLGARPHSVLEAGDEVMMPGPLARATGLNRATIPWKDAPLGERRYDLPALRRAAASARIVHIEPGSVLHSEKHGGQLVLVLWGAYVYDGERFERGDLQDIDASGFKTFASASPEGATFVTAVAPMHQAEILRTAH
jgi:putative transcriptional regulator